MKATIHINKSFPNHEGIPGHQGGSLPKSGTATSSGAAGAGKSVTQAQVHDAFMSSNVIDSVKQDYEQKRVPKSGGGYEMRQNPLWPKDFQGKNGSFYRLRDVSPILFDKLEKMGFSGSKDFTRTTTWTHPTSPIKIQFSKGQTGANVKGQGSQYRYARIYED
jgi:hypothetical protein